MAGDVYGLMGQLTYETLIGDKFAVVVDLNSHVEDVDFDELGTSVEGREEVPTTSAERLPAVDKAGKVGKSRSASSNTSRLSTAK